MTAGPGRLPLALSILWIEAKAGLRDFARAARRRESVALAALLALLAAAACLALFPRDAGLLAALHCGTPEQERAARHVAHFFSTWGDYLTYNVPFALAVWLYGAWRRSPFWQRVALAAFLGATLAGLFDDGLRLTLGRPRPDTHLPDHFYGLPQALRGGYQSFPSGHTASVVGMAVALLATEARLGLPAALFALGVMWGRLELDRHWPSDVAVGFLIGLYFGLMVGLGMRPRLRAAGADGNEVRGGGA